MRRLSMNNIDKLKIPHMIRLLYGSLVRPKRRQIMYNTTPITGVYASALSALGIEPAAGTQAPIAALDKLCKKAFGGEKADRLLLYNPDAVALWLFQKYNEMFTDAQLASGIMLPLLSVMPSVTPVCFASMYTGLMPAEHGIRAYVKPVLRCNTIFDDLVKAGKRVALVSTGNDSISMIFLKRNIDYYIYDTVDEVNAKAMELMEKDCYDVMVVYNGNYDGTMHKFGTESEEAIAALKANLAFYCRLVDAVKQHWAQHNTLYGFMPDHGCHEIDGGCGAHGLDMEEDMNIVHLYGCNARK